MALDCRDGIKTLKVAKIPKKGDMASGSFSYVNSLGSFIFVGESSKQVLEDLNRVLSEYRVKTEPA